MSEEMFLEKLCSGVGDVCRVRHRWRIKGREGGGSIPILIVKDCQQSHLWRDEWSGSGGGCKAVAGK